MLMETRLMGELWWLIGAEACFGIEVNHLTSRQPLCTAQHSTAQQTTRTSTGTRKRYPNRNRSPSPGERELRTTHRGFHSLFRTPHAVAGERGRRGAVGGGGNGEQLQHDRLGVWPQRRAPRRSTSPSSASSTSTWVSVGARASQG